MSKPPTPPAKQAIIEVLEAEPTATVAQIAVSAGVGRSTASKMLAQLEGDGTVHRTEGGRDGKRRLPDIWSLVGKQKAARKDENGNQAPEDSDAKGDRLRAGQLQPLVLAYLKENAASGPHGPTTVAKALQRSSGAVGNCLVRLTNAKKVKLDTEKPRQYSLA